MLLYANQLQGGNSNAPSWLVPYITFSVSWNSVCVCVCHYITSSSSSHHQLIIRRLEWHALANSSVLGGEESRYLILLSHCLLSGCRTPAGRLTPPSFLHQTISRLLSESVIGYSSIKTQQSELLCASERVV